MYLSPIGSIYNNNIRGVTMIKSLNTLLCIEKLTGKGSQKLIMKELQDNWSPELEYILNVALNQFKPTHLNTLAISAPHFVGDHSFETFKALMDECMSVRACTLELKTKVKSFVDYYIDTDISNILTMIVTKNLNIGLGRKLVNKALGRQFLPTPEAQLADKDSTKIRKWGTQFLRVNIKYDGVRMISKYSHDNGWSFFTRNFNEIDSSAMTNITDQLNRGFCNHIKEGVNFFVDGELIAKDSIVAGENSSQARQSITGQVNKILKGNGKQDMDLGFTYVIFDMEKSSVLETGSGNTPYYARRNILEGKNDYEWLNIKIPNLTLAKEWIVKNDAEGLAQIKIIYKALINDGEEGVIIKNPDSVYTCGRTANWVKMKEVLSADVKVVDCIEGTGKHQGKLGAITVEFSTGQRVNVGTGLSDNQRHDFWQNQERLLGSIVEIEYNAKCKDKDGKESLFIPVFINVRNDKTEADKY